MIEIGLQQLANLFDQAIHDVDTGLSIRGVTIDSRKECRGQLFVAIKGDQFDGHDFVAAAFENGATAALVERRLDIAIPQVTVTDCRRALGRLANYWRHSCNARVIALTGSNGKTTVKEMLFQILTKSACTHATRGNLNNDIGVPLTLLELSPEDRYAIIEMGANHRGEIATLAQIAAPDIVYVNNVAAAHLNGFGTVQGVIEAKGELYTYCRSAHQALFNYDEVASAQWQASCKAGQMFSCALDNDADFVASWLAGDDGIELEIVYQGQSKKVSLKVYGEHNARNAAAAVALATIAGLDFDLAVSHLNEFSGVGGRLQMLRGPRHSRLIDDSYNANPDSLQAGLKVLCSLQGESWLALGDMGELGVAGEDLHRKVALTARSYGVRKFFAFGRLSCIASEEFGDAGFCFDSLQEMAGDILENIDGNVNLLVKGSRSAGMDRLVKMLLADQNPGVRHMLFSLAEYLSQYQSGFNVFQYLTLRTILGVLTALTISLIVGPTMIRYLSSYNIGQNVRDDGPESHFSKAGTPTMGGALILVAIVTSTLLWSDLSSRFVWVVLFVTIGFGAIGWIDDYRKIVYGNSRGLSAKTKYVWQSVIGLTTALVLFNSAQFPIETQLIVPFIKDILIDLGWIYVALTYFVIVGSSNAVNLTDGLDGLAILPTVLVGGALGVFAYLTGNINFSGYLGIPYVPGVGEMVVFCGAIVGSGLGFLWFNTYPAQVFMGDVGALALGAALGTIAVIVRQEIVLFIMGGIFVVETLSVVLQVASFKLTGRRIFRMAPIHHHFELKGWPEPRIIVRFWIITVVLVLIGLASLKIR